MLKRKNSVSENTATQMSYQATVHMEEPDPQPLNFEGDRGSWLSVLIALILVLAIVAWMGSGMLGGEEADDTPQQEAAVALVKVATMTSQAQEITQIFVAEGQAVPDRESVIRAEISGEIAEVFVQKGETLETNQVIARFDSAQNEAEVERAKEDLRVAQREFDNAEALRNRGAATADRVSSARAALVSAQTALTQAEDDLSDAILKAPFAGRLDALDIDQGEFVAAGTDVGRILDTSPLTVVVQVPQRALGSVSIGQKAQVVFITGTEVFGELVFIGNSADAQTRTFRAEIEVPNPQNAIAAGLSAQVRVPTGTATAHFISPAILSLGTDGTLGIKTVTDEGLVKFYEVAIERAQADGLWISGLPDTAEIITIGQGFVTDGEEVDARPEEELAGEAS